jgi:hypothetical protein
LLVTLTLGCRIITKFTINKITSCFDLKGSTVEVKVTSDYVYNELCNNYTVKPNVKVKVTSDYVYNELCNNSTVKPTLGLTVELLHS